MRGWWLPVAALAGLGVGAAAMWQVDAARGGAAGPAIRAYLLSHPEVIPEAMAKLQERESSRVLAQYRDEVVRPFAGAWAGNPQGDVTVVEYFDYNCGYCRASLPAIASLLRRDRGVKLVYRELPILSPESHDAARASLAAAAQGKFAAFHQALYAAGPVSAQTIAQAAQATGVDPARVPAGADEELARNLAVTRALGVGGTPSWVVGDRVLSGAQPLDELERAVAAAREGKG